MGTFFNVAIVFILVILLFLAVFIVKYISDIEKDKSAYKKKLKIMRRKIREDQDIEDGNDTSNTQQDVSEDKKKKKKKKPTVINT